VARCARPGLSRDLELRVALADVLAMPGFGAGPPLIGAELELSLIDAALRPLPVNRAVLAKTVDGRVKLELVRFNLEFNAQPVPLAGQPFTALGAQLEDALAVIGRARRNFYMAARSGLDAELFWPIGEPPSPRPLPAAELVRRLIPTARNGLAEGGVSGEEADPLLAIVEARVARRQTGARWQRWTLAALDERLPRAEAIPAMFERYLAASATGRPVHEWPIG
jgi:hypothetical protein